MESPETVPVYFTAVEPTVPNLMASPSTVPFTGTVPDVDRLILPASFDPACTQVRVNVPENVPSYSPVHFPDSPTACCAEDAAELTADDADDTAADKADAPAPDDGADDELRLPHPDRPIATTAPTPAARTTAHARVRYTTLSPTSLTAPSSDRKSTILPCAHQCTSELTQFG